jgi:hypothetical protein
VEVPRIAFIVCSLGTAGTALAAAYWFRSSQPFPVESSDIAASISDNEAIYILDARVSVDTMVPGTSNAVGTGAGPRCRAISD